MSEILNFIKAHSGHSTGALFPSGGGLCAGHGGEASLPAVLRHRGRHLPERALRGVHRFLHLLRRDGLDCGGDNAVPPGGTVAVGGARP